MIWRETRSSKAPGFFCRWPGLSRAHLSTLPASSWSPPIGFTHSPPESPVERRSCSRFPCVSPSAREALIPSPTATWTLSNGQRAFSTAWWLPWQTAKARRRFSNPGNAWIWFVGPWPACPTWRRRPFTGLLVDYARRRGAQAIVRGLRAVSDFEFEFQLALMNRKLNEQVETIFMMPRESYTFLSSRLVKEIAMLGGDVADFVPPPVLEALKARRVEKPR